MHENDQHEYVEVRTYINDDEEKVTQHRTYQDNGWTRINEYYPDGTTTEMYEKE